MINAKYRGIRIDGKGFVYGYLVDWRSVNGDCEIMDLSHAYDVLPETVGQYTGKTDKNSKEIYQGDKFNPISENLTYTVVFKDAQFGLESELGYWGSLKRYFELAEKHGWSCEVIGNIHEIEVSNA